MGELARLAGTNRTNFSNYLNQELGTIFSDYINRQRVDYVRQQLQNEKVCRKQNSKNT